MHAARFWRSAISVRIDTTVVVSNALMCGEACKPREWSWLLRVSFALVTGATVAATWDTVREFASVSKVVSAPLAGATSAR
jgi:hypothetical protein